MLEGDPLSGQYVVLAADREEFLQKQGILQALEKGCQAKGNVLGTSSPTLGVIDKPGDYRYDLTRFPHRGFLLTQGLPLLRSSNYRPLNFFEECQ